MSDNGRTNIAPAALQQILQTIPKVDEFLSWPDVPKNVPYSLVRKAVRMTLDDFRRQILAGKIVADDGLSKKDLVAHFQKQLERLMAFRFQSVINATGVVVHTNLGRSLLPESAMENIREAGVRYSNLEFDLETGKRGSRYSLVEQLLCDLTGAEAALVVNNNAAAVLLVLETLAAGREVVVSRGQLVEIGGSFRVPEVMAKSGAILVEVGATNRTHEHDYESAVNQNTAMLLKVHSSNFKIIGFTSEVDLEQLVALGKKHDVLVMEDLGSGLLIDLSKFGLAKEPTVQEAISTGVDVVTFSGDKLLGGPQAGLILGKKRIIDQIKKNPMNRALRIDKFTLVGLESVLRLYWDEEAAVKEIPTLAMLTAAENVIAKRAKRLIRLLHKHNISGCNVELMHVDSRVGGGALPEQPLKSCAVALQPNNISVNELERKLRLGEHHVIARIENDMVVLDMRTVGDGEIVKIADAIGSVFGVGSY